VKQEISRVSVCRVDSTDLEEMYAAVDRLSLNDASIAVTKDHSNSLGSGLRIGFLGFLHMEVFNQRLADEFNMRVVVTTPSVPYRIERSDGTITEISSVSNWCVLSRALVTTSDSSVA
jgi:translation elongation factor EF-4